MTRANAFSLLLRFPPPEVRENERTSEVRENERRSARERAAKPREKSVAPAPIFSRFFCPRPPLLPLLLRRF